MPGVTDVVVISTGVAVRGRDLRPVHRRRPRAAASPGDPAPRRASPTTTVLRGAGGRRAAARARRRRPPTGRGARSPSTSAATAPLEPNCAIADVRRRPRRDLVGAEVADRRPAGRSPRQLGLPPDKVRCTSPRAAGRSGASCSSTPRWRPPRSRSGWASRSSSCGTAPTTPGRAARTRWPPRGCGSPTLGGHRAELRAAAHQRRHRPRPRPRRDHHRRSRRSCRSGDIGFSETFFQLTQTMPYDFGVSTRLLNETDKGFNTGSMRNVYSPDVDLRPRADRRPARREDGQGPVPVPARRSCATTAPRAVLDKVAEVGELGPVDAGGHRAGHRASTPSTRPSAPRWWRSTAGPETVDRPDPRRRDRAAGHQGRLRRRRRPRRQPARPGGADDGRHHGRHRAGPDLQPAPARRALPGSAAGTTTSTPGSGTPRPSCEIIVMPQHLRASPAARASSASPRRWPRSPARTAARPGRCPPRFPINHGTLSFEPKPTVPPVPAVADRRPRTTSAEGDPGARTHLPRQRRAGHRRRRDDVRLLWVLRDILGVTGPKYGCGINVCKACTSHLNGKAFNPCAVPVARPRGRPTRSPPSRDCRPPSARPAPDAAGVARPRRRPVRLLPAGPDHGGGRRWCGGRAAEGREITDADLDGLRNICRCGTYTRIREAIRTGAASMRRLGVDGGTP